MCGMAIMGIIPAGMGPPIGMPIPPCTVVGGVGAAIVADALVDATELRW